MVSRQGDDKQGLPGQILPLLVTLKLCCDMADRFLAYPLGTMKGTCLFKMYRSTNLKLFTMEISAQKDAAVPQKEDEMGFAIDGPQGERS